MSIIKAYFMNKKENGFAYDSITREKNGNHTWDPLYQATNDSNNEWFPCGFGSQGSWF